MSCISLRYFFKSCTPDKRQSETLILSTNVDQNSLETGFFDCHLSPDFSIAICRPTVDKWQSKTLFLAISICIKQQTFVTCYIFVLIKAKASNF